MCVVRCGLPALSISLRATPKSSWLVLDCICSTYWLRHRRIFCWLNSAWKREEPLKNVARRMCYLLRLIGNKKVEVELATIWRTSHGTPFVAHNIPLSAVLYFLNEKRSRGGSSYPEHKLEPAEVCFTPKNIRKIFILYIKHLCNFLYNTQNDERRRRRRR